MRRILHLSDLHFGRVDPGVVGPLVEAAWDIKPDLIVLSGDFVQNGSREEWQEAREFVEQLPRPWLAVPGNHDLPFANVFKRFTQGLNRYREYITQDLEPFYKDDEIAVLGVNTARAWMLRGGRIDEWQVRRIERRLCSLDENLTTVLVTHHPFDLAETYHRRELVGGARTAMGRFAQTIDLMLAGHMHVGHAGRTAVRYRFQGRSAIFVQAGTATSTRGRGQPNSFNLIKLEGQLAAIERYQWQASKSRFGCICDERFILDYEAPVCMLPEAAVKEEEVQVVYA